MIANFTAVGDATHPMVRVYDAGAAPPAVRPTAAEVADTAGALANVIYSLQNFTNFNTINIQTLGGDDVISVIGRNDGSLTVNVDGGAGNDSLVLPGTGLAATTRLQSRPAPATIRARPMFCGRPPPPRVQTSITLAWKRSASTAAAARERTR